MWLGDGQVRVKLASRRHTGGAQLVVRVELTLPPRAAKHAAEPKRTSFVLQLRSRTRRTEDPEYYFLKIVRGGRGIRADRAIH